MLGPQGQGVVTTVTTVTSITVLLGTFGSGIGLRIRTKENPTAEDISGYIIISLAGAVLAIALSVTVIPLVLPGAWTLWIIGLTAGVAFSQYLARQMADIAQANGHPAQSIFSLVVLTGVQLGTFAAFWANGSASTKTLLLSAILGAGSQAVYCLRFAPSWYVSRLNISDVKPLLRLGLPSLGYSVGLVVLQRLDRVILAAVNGPNAVGVYAAAASLAEVIRLLPMTIGQLLFAQTAQAGRITRSTAATRIQLLFLCVIGGCILILLAPLLPSILGPQYTEAIPIFRVLVAAEVLFGMALMDSRIILGLGRIRTVSSAVIVLVIACVPTYTLTAMAFGPMGAAVTSLVLYSALGATLAFLYRGHIPARQSKQ